MGTVSVSLPSDGETIDAADYNTPINTIVSEVNGNLDNSNIASGAAISGSKLADASVTNAKLATGAGEPGGAWTSWTPTLTNFSLGNGTMTAAYTKIGPTVYYRIKVVFGSTTSIAATASFSAPVTAASIYSSTVAMPVGRCIADDAGATFYFGTPIFSSSTSIISIRWDRADGTFTTLANSASTTPMTWTTGDVFTASGTYEAAA